MFKPVVHGGLKGLLLASAASLMFSSASWALKWDVPDDPTPPESSPPSEPGDTRSALEKTRDAEGGAATSAAARTIGDEGGAATSAAARGFRDGSHGKSGD